MPEQSKKAKEVLVIDDDPTILQSIGRQLRNENLSLEPVNDPVEALKKIEKKKYDLVLCDIKMKPINGLEVLQRIKSDHPHLPVIIITGFVDDQLYAQARKIGCSALLIKPVPRRQLIDSIQTVLHSSR